MCTAVSVVWVNLYAVICDPESIDNGLSQHFTQNKPAHLMFSMSADHLAS